LGAADPPNSLPASADSALVTERFQWYHSAVGDEKLVTIVALRIVTVSTALRLLYSGRRRRATGQKDERRMFLTRIGWGECLIILVVLIIIAGLAFRGGYFRGRRRH